MVSSTKEQSNPFSTGGGGVVFENKVQAIFTLALLADAPIPGLPHAARATSIKLQAKYEGVNTDDFVMEAVDRAGSTCRLFGQVKHEIKIGSSEDSTFSEVMTSAWKDFSGGNFNPKTDAIALVVGVLPKNDVNNTLPVLEWARYSSDAAEFIRKSQTKGFTSDAKKNRLQMFRDQLNSANDGVTLSDHELWSFLKVFYVLSYDVDAKASVVSTFVNALISCYTDQPSHAVMARIVEHVQSFNHNGGTITRENLGELGEIFKPAVSAKLAQDILKLSEQGEYIYEGIRDSIQNVHVNRDVEMTNLEQLFLEDGIILVSGDRGAGKSALVKHFLSQRLKDCVPFYLRAEDLDKPSLGQVFSSIGLESTIGQIAGHLALIKNKVLVIESIERILELKDPTAFQQLLRFIQKSGGWTFIATGRSYGMQQLNFTHLQPADIKFQTVSIGGFTIEQLAHLCVELPALGPLIKNPSLSAIMRVPFFVDLAVRALANNQTFTDTDTESEFRSRIWESVIARSDRRGDGMPDRRERTFVEISKKRAKSMVFGVPARDFDAGAVEQLEADDLILRVQNSYVSPSHDVFEDWALDKFIDQEYEDHADSAFEFLNAIGSEPAINRGFRLWLLRRLREDATVVELVEQILSSESISDYWKDETLAAVLHSDTPRELLNSIQLLIVKNDFALFEKLLFILRTTCQRPWEGLKGLLPSEALEQFPNTLILTPFGRGWSACFEFAYNHRQSLHAEILRNVFEALSVWGDSYHLDGWADEALREAALLALHIIDVNKDSYSRDEMRSKLILIVLRLAYVVREELAALFERDVFIVKNANRPRYVRSLTQLVLNRESAGVLCQHMPDTVIRLARHEWFKVEDDHYYAYRRNDSFGLENVDLSPGSSGLKGPFHALLTYHSDKAISFILELCNWCTDALVEAESPHPKAAPEWSDLYDESKLAQVTLRLNNGSDIVQWVSPQLWKAYRGLSVVPGMLHCALMALENWFIRQAQSEGNDAEFKRVFTYLLENSGSGLITGLLASIAVAFPKKVGSEALPIIRCEHFYGLEINRIVKERTPMGYPRVPFGRELLVEAYIDERNRSNARPWRARSLEDLLLQIQLDPELQPHALAILDKFKNLSPEESESIQYMLHRTDTRDMTVVPTQEKNIFELRVAKPLPTELEQKRAAHHAQQSFDYRIFRLHRWSDSVFNKNALSSEPYETYHQALQEAIGLLDDVSKGVVQTKLGLMALGAVVTTAAIGLRDHLDTLSDEDLQWIIYRIVEVVRFGANDFNGFASTGTGDLGGESACAVMIPKLFEVVQEEDFEEVKHLIATCLTHPNDYVRLAAAKGVRHYLWDIDRDFALVCSTWLMRLSEIEQACYALIRSGRGGVKGEEAVALMEGYRAELVSAEFSADATFFFNSQHAGALHLILLMQPLASDNDHVKAILSGIVNYICDGSEDDRDSWAGLEAQEAMQKCLAEHVVASVPANFEPVRDWVLQGCRNDPHFMYMVKLCAEIELEKSMSLDAIWGLWRLFEPEMQYAATADLGLLPHSKRESVLKFLRGMLFLDYPIRGKPNEAERARMTHGARYLIDFTKQFVMNSIVFESLTTHMYYYPDHFLRQGIHTVAEALRRDPDLASKEVGAYYYLEMAIARFLNVDERGELSRAQHKDCLTILDCTVKKGSARAYFLRENLVSSRRISK
ncbi:ATP-binding protein [Pseudomonas sp. HS6]|uniref:ATP-binding protein n=1 Tax=Pseudomonas sp. HS6 TaxID=2850559 RepID=UPI002018CFF7|nr:ATP-binding protein [Pseudomonas sp. HS6]UQS16354.1 ATP-binding protein [Pseudomonas sp. HS6]